MKTSHSIIFLTILFGTLACGTATPQPALEPAPVAETDAVPLPENSAVETQAAVPTSEPGTTLAPVMSAPSGLRVIYLREGNLWSWTEAGGNQQLTDTGDISTARLSNDGQWLAFIRGSEVWTVRMDGTDARQLMTQDTEGSALWFAPNGSLLAISTRDHIDVINLTDGISKTVVTYPVIPMGYYPEVIWSPDSLGFKTVIFPQSESGQAELLFVFTDGTVASLAKFSVVSLNKSLAYISPDGGYIIYAAKMNDGQESLYLMDSSGAARPYGEPGLNIRANGWLPDSKRFVYTDEASQESYLGDIAGPPMRVPVFIPSRISWVDAEQFLALENVDLVVGDLNGGRLIIDSGIQDYDFSP